MAKTNMAANVQFLYPSASKEDLENFLKDVDEVGQ